MYPLDMRTSIFHFSLHHLNSVVENFLSHSWFNASHPFFSQFSFSQLICLPLQYSTSNMGGSSSHRRNKRNNRNLRTSYRSGSVPTPSSVTLTFDDREITSGPGYNLLRKSGWQPGDSLGILSSSPSARSTPIPISYKQGRAGLGAAHDQIHQTLASSPTSLPRSYTSPSCPTTSLANDFANMDIFDPLRPRCPFDSTHVVSNIKLLRKHEQNCPANPARYASNPIPIPQLTPNPQLTPFEAAPSSFNPFSSLASPSNHSSSTSVCSESDSVMSDISFLSNGHEEQQISPVVLSTPQDSNL